MARAGRPAYEATEKDRKTVEAMVACGMPHDDIGKVIGCSDVSLRKHFRNEINTGAARANAKVAATLFTMATSGECPAATFFWMKARLRWRETLDHRFVDKDGEDRKLIEQATLEAWLRGAPVSD